MEYIKCPECKKIIEKSSRSCTNCGYPFDGSEQIINIKICPECQSFVEENVSVCETCGYPFEEKENEEYEKMLREAEEKAREFEKKAQEAEAKLKKMQEESEQKRIFEQKQLEKQEKQKKLEELKKKALEDEKRAQEAERKLAELKEMEEQPTNQNTSREGEGDFHVDHVIVSDDKSINSDSINANDMGERQKQEDLVSEKIEMINKKFGGYFHNKKVISIGIVAIVGICFIAFAFRGTPVESIELEYKNASIDLDTIGKIDYTITPSDATKKEVKWKSSDESIVDVDENGNLVAKKEGTCEITVTAHNGKSDTCELTVTPAGPDLQSIYYQYCESAYASVAADGTYLSIDTKPNNMYFSREDDAIQAIFNVNEALGIPDSVIQKMSKTRALDGVQSQVCGDIEVSWSYHPDNGLEVIYSLNN